MQCHRILPVSPGVQELSEHVWQQPRMLYPVILHCIMNDSDQVNSLGRYPFLEVGFRAQQGRGCRERRKSPCKPPMEWIDSGCRPFSHVQVIVQDLVYDQSLVHVLFVSQRAMPSVLANQVVKGKASW